MYKTWSYATFYHSLPQANTNRISTPENDLIYKFIQGLYGFILNLTFLNFLDFYKKNPSKNKKIHKSCFDKQRKSWTYLKKMCWKKYKTFKAIWAVLGHSKTKIFSVGQPWWPVFFQDLLLPLPPTVLVLLRPCPPQMITNQLKVNIIGFRFHY